MSRLGRAIGTTLLALWPDSWEQVRPMGEKALADEACRFEDLPISMARRGAAEET